MKVTPLDLRQTHLSTSLRGYDRDEVRTLLTDAADDYEAALRELDRLPRTCRRPTRSWSNTASAKPTSATRC